MEICININVIYLQKKKKKCTETQITEKYRYINKHKPPLSNIFQLSLLPGKKKNQRKFNARINTSMY